MPFVGISGEFRSQESRPFREQLDFEDAQWGVPEQESGKMEDIAPAPPRDRTDIADDVAAPQLIFSYIPHRRPEGKRFATGQSPEVRFIGHGEIRGRDYESFVIVCLCHYSLGDLHHFVGDQRRVVGNSLRPQERNAQFAT